MQSIEFLTHTLRFLLNKAWEFTGHIYEHTKCAKFKVGRHLTVVEIIKLKQFIHKKVPEENLP